MHQKLEQSHDTDGDGNPAGGESRATGLVIAWQDGPLRAQGEDVWNPANGAFVETVLDAVLGRLRFYQESKFACDANAVAINHIREALSALDGRTKEREARGVEGTHAV